MNLTEVVIGLHIKGEPGIWRKAFPGGSDGKESACNAGDLGSHAWVGKIPWRREWQPTPVFLPGESHRQRSLVDYSPWGRKESDTTKQLTLALSFFFFFSVERGNTCQDWKYSFYPVFLYLLSMGQ